MNSRILKIEQQLEQLKVYVEELQEAFSKMEEVVIKQQEQIESLHANRQRNTKHRRG